MFPSFDALSFSRLHANDQSPFLFKNIRIEDTATLEEAFKLLTLAIQNSSRIGFSYKEIEYSDMCPYRLVNDRGYWYLAASHNEVLKLFKVADLLDIRVSNEGFERLKEHEKKLTHSKQLLIAETPIELILKVNASIVEIFIEREELPNKSIG
jgi:predicted DNA-binding transcriptional regulator YafY